MEEPLEVLSTWLVRFWPQWFLQRLSKLVKLGYIESLHDQDWSLTASEAA